MLEEFKFNENELIEYLIKFEEYMQDTDLCEEDKQAIADYVMLTSIKTEK